jgi:hypothetical protein
MKYTQCPVCHLPFNTTNGSKCINFKQCGFWLKKGPSTHYLGKYFKSGNEIWWIYSQNVDKYEIRINRRYHEISFVPPFDITEERLLQLLLFI